jgi:HKD family nuclease
MQGFDDRSNHSIKLLDYLSKPDIENALFSVAFVKTSGIKLIENQLKVIHDKSVFFIGIRNGITSIQALFTLIDLKTKVFVVDTGTTSVIYHPKVFIITTRDNIYSIFGSANLTSGGLFSNIEFSSLITFDKADTQISDFKDKLQGLPSQFPSNIYEIRSKKEAFALYKRGLLIDERVTRSPSLNLTGNISAPKDITPRIKLNRPKSTSLKVNRKPRSTIIKKAIPVLNQWILVWESKELKERDLCIPSASGTNPTGSMLFKKGNFEDIDQREYFRDEVFQELDWIQDAKTPHYERTIASFVLEIRGINYGQHDLKLSHDTDKESRSYKQNNSMTQVHWGEIRKFIGDRELLGENLKLFKQNSTPPIYMIKIG